MVYSGGALFITDQSKQSRMQYHGMSNWLKNYQMVPEIFILEKEVIWEYLKYQTLFSLYNRHDLFLPNGGIPLFLISLLNIINLFDTPVFAKSIFL